MVLPARRRPDRCHLAQTRAYAEVAGDAEDEAVEESGGATGGEDDGEGACEGYPSAVWWGLSVGLFDYLLRESKVRGICFTSGLQKPCRSWSISRTSSRDGRLGLRPSWFGG